jgi:TolB-like protein
MSFLAELKRRRVVRVALVYAATMYALIQAADLILPRLGVPDRIITLIVWLAVLGFPVAIALAWALQITSDGVRIEDRGAAIEETAKLRWLDWRTVVTAAVLVITAAVGGWIAARSGPADAVTLRSVAVLPFVDMTPEKDMEYFGDGMAEEILNALAGLGELKVAGRTSSFSFKDQKQDLKSIGNALGVATVLEGSIRSSGNQLRITAQLVRTADQSHLWSDVFQYASNRDVFEIQDEIARAVVNALRLKLTGDAGAKLVEWGTDNAEAYEAFMRGRAEWNRRTIEMTQASIRSFQRAVELDPKFARAHAALADAFNVAATNGSMSFTVAHPRSRQAIDQALALDSLLPDAHIAQAAWSINALDFSAAEAAFKRGLELNSKHAYGHFWYGQLLDQTNRPDSALREVERAHALDPLASRIATGIGDHYRLRHEFARAIEQYRRVLARDPQFERAQVTLALSHAMAGQIDSARQTREQLSANAGKVVDLTIAAVDGRRAEIDAAVRQDPTSPDFVSVAEFYVLLGDLNTAFQVMERGVSARDPAARWLGTIQYTRPSLSADPRWTAVLARAGLDRYWTAQ